MKRLLACITVFVNAVVYAQLAGDTQHKWIDSFERFKMSVRPLNEAEKHTCEHHLRQILQSLDAGGSCTVDRECTLLNQDPFGAAVPIRLDRSKEVMSEMKQFASSCDNHSIRSTQDNGTVSVPACVKGRCMALISLSR